MKDKEYIQNYLSGDSSSLEQLLENHLQRIFSACYRVCLNESDANDVTQEVLIKIIKNIKNFSFKSEFSTWYFRIAYNESINFLKKKKDFLDLDELPEQTESENTIPEEIDKKSLREKVTEEINKLPVIDRNIILYFYYDDLKIKEISIIMDIKENTIKTKLARAKKKLKSHLEYIGKT